MSNPYYFIGKGKLYISLSDKSDGLRYISNVEEFKLTITDKVETLKDYDSLAGGNIQQVATIDKVDMSLTFTDLSPANLALAIFGAIGTPVTASTASDEKHVAHKGCLLPLTYVNPSTVTLTNDSTVTYALGTDYTVTGAGLFIPATSSIVEGSTVTVASYNYSDSQSIEAMTTTGSEYRVYFDGVNTANYNKPRIVDLFKVRFGPIKDMSYKGETFAKIQIAGEVLKDSTITTPGKSQFFREMMVL